MFVFAALARCADVPLRLDVAIEHSEQCQTGERVVVRLQLELRLRNISDSSRIVSKLLDIDHYDLSESANDLRNGRFVQSRKLETIPMLGRSVWASEKPSAEFFQLIGPSSEALVGRRKIMVILRNSKAPASREAIKPGKYALRIEVDPWRESRKLGRTLARRWATNGFLQLDRLMSEPIQLHIDAIENPPECKGPPLIVSGESVRPR